MSGAEFQPDRELDRTALPDPALDLRMSRDLAGALDTIVAAAASLQSSARRLDMVATRLEARTVRPGEPDGTARRESLWQYTPQITVGIVAAVIAVALVVYVFWGRYQ
ncbi:hypothetical protein [Dactylosporangium sp. NPDC051541]|uniref:hypothetical protein n=1 Tax=Dactylosporangium sp. NPDC051541 TaxID=3363977 RepID=UPI0037AAC1A7